MKPSLKVKEFSVQQKAKGAETARERKEYFDYLFAQVGAEMSSELRVLTDDGTYIDVNADREDEVMADTARRAHRYTCHLIQVRDFAAFDEKVASCDADE
jgi:hypothetical protein